MNFKKKNFQAVPYFPSKIITLSFPSTCFTCTLPSEGLLFLPSFIHLFIQPSLRTLPSWFLTKHPNLPYISFSHFSTDPQITTVNLCLQQNKCFIFIFSYFSFVCVCVFYSLFHLTLLNFFVYKKKNENLVKLVHSGIITSNSLVCSLYASTYQDVHLTSSSTFFAKTKID